MKMPGHFHPFFFSLFYIFNLQKYTVYSILYTMNTKDKIFNFIKKKKQVTPSEIADEFLLSRGMVHRHLKSLLTKGLIIKSGSAPIVSYSPIQHILVTQNKKFKYDMKIKNN